MKRLLCMTTALAMCLSFMGCNTTESNIVVEGLTTDEIVVEEPVATALSSSANAANYILSDQFSDKDYEIGCIADSYSNITLADGNSTSDDSSVLISGNQITITQEGAYLLEGDLPNGQIVVDADENAKIQLTLNGVTISNYSTAPIYVVEADKVFVTTQASTDNVLSATFIEDEDSNVDAVIFAKSDLTLNGEGTLEITATNGNGITSKDDLVVTSGTYDITADNHGLEANNSIRIAGGTFQLTTQKDGLHCEHDEDTTLGYIYIANGTFAIDAQGDGMDSSSFVEIETGTFDITTGGGSINAPVTTSAQMGGGMMGGGMAGGMGRGDMTNTEEMPTMGERPEMTGEMPENSGEMTPMDGMGGDMGQMPGGRGTMGGGMTDTGEMPTMGERPEMTGEMPETDGQMGGMGQMPGMMGQGGMNGETTETGEMPQMGERPTMGEMPTDETTTEADDTVSTKAIKAEQAISIYDGTFTIDACDDAIHSNGDVYIAGGTFAIQTGDDAFRAELITEIAGGTMDITKCYEGLEGHTVIVSGGNINIYADDDGINSVKSTLASSDLEVAIYITGGTLVIDANNEGDGFDSNGNIYVTGGNVLISGTTATTDTSLDYGNTATITGGTFIATGSTSQTRQNFGSDSVQGSIMVDLLSFQSGAITLTDSQGNVLVDYTPVKEYQTIHISMPDIVVGETYTLVAGTETQTIQMDSLIYGENSDNGPGGMGGGGMGQMGGGMSPGGMGGGGR